jgi:ribosome-associated protein
VVVIDMHKLTPMCDFFVICSGKSEVHVRAISEEIDTRMRERGVKPAHIEGLSDGRWVLMDYLSVVTHVFTPEAREYYDLEHLWADAPRETLESEPISATPENGVQQS